MLDAWFLTVPSAVPSASAISRLLPAASHQAQDLDSLFVSGSGRAQRIEVAAGVLEVP
jgi:hypothetical protein